MDVHWGVSYSPFLLRTSSASLFLAFWPAGVDLSGASTPSRMMMASVLRRKLFPSIISTGVAFFIDMFVLDSRLFTLLNISSEGPYSNYGGGLLSPGRCGSCGLK